METLPPATHGRNVFTIPTQRPTLLCELQHLCYQVMKSPGPLAASQETHLLHGHRKDKDESGGGLRERRIKTWTFRKEGPD